MRLSSLLTSLLPLLTLPIPSTSSLTASDTPKPPALEFLYTCFVTCHNGLYETNGPRGLRTAIPIVGGNVTGPRISGRIRDLGADWGMTDVQTGVSQVLEVGLKDHQGNSSELLRKGTDWKSDTDGKLYENRSSARTLDITSSRTMEQISSCKRVDQHRRTAIFT